MVSSGQGGQSPEFGEGRRLAQRISSDCLDPSDKYSYGDLVGMVDYLNIVDVDRYSDFHRTGH